MLRALNVTEMCFVSDGSFVVFRKYLSKFKCCRGCQTHRLDKGPQWCTTEPELLDEPREVVQRKDHHCRVEDHLVDIGENLPLLMMVNETRTESMALRNAGGSCKLARMKTSHSGAVWCPGVRGHVERGMEAQFPAETGISK